MTRVKFPFIDHPQNSFINNDIVLVFNSFICNTSANQVIEQPRQTYLFLELNFFWYNFVLIICHLPFLVIYISTGPSKYI
jgi:hypothetical protein